MKVHIDRLTVERCEAEKEINALHAELRAAVDALKLWDGIGFDFWLTNDEWSAREPDQDDEREWVNLSSITRELVAAYDAKHPEDK